MAESSTLRPLSTRDRAALTPDGDAAILAQALERFQLASDAEAAERAQQLEALRFRSGDHTVAAMRGAGGEPYPAPTMTVDRQSAFLKQTVNAYRRAPLSIRVRPKSGGATKQVADVLEGKIREIEQESEAEVAYTVALDQAAGQGLGYFRLVTEWVDPHSFEQTLRICPIYSRFTVYADPTSRHPAGLDLGWAFVVERLSRDAFRSQYGMEPAPASQWSGTGDDVWYDDDSVQVADYFYKTWEEVELAQMPGGVVIPTQGIGNIDPTWPKRTTRIPTVWWAKMCGSAVLSKTRWLGQYIPLVRVEGTRIDVDGQTIRTGIIQQTLTSQLAYDYAFCAEMEALALAPKAPYIAAAEQIAEYKEYWDRANDPYRPYLPYKPLAGVEMPRRQSVEPAIQALTLARQQAAEDMRAVLGMYAPSMGEPGQERSGTAIRSQKLEGDQSTFHFPANLAWSIRAVGLQIVDILPKLYSRPTTLRQIGKDGSVEMTPVNQMDAADEQEQRLLSRGSYDVAVDSGPAYSTQREMAAERLGELGRVLPQEMLPLISDLWVAQLDIPYAEEISARLKTIVPLEALDATKDKNPQTAIAALQNQVQQATQALQAMQQQIQEATQIAEVSKQQLVLTEQRNATLETRLADKAQDNQIDMQKSQWQYEVDKEKNQLALLELQLKYSQQAQMPQNGVPEPAEESELMPVEVIERGPDGAYVTVPDPGDVSTSPPVAPQEGRDAPAETAPGSTPGVQGESAPPSEDAPPPDDASLAASQSEGEDADVADDAATVPFVNRRIKQLNAKRRDLEKQLGDERNQNALRQAQLEARLDTLTRVLSGAAPDVPASPPPPTGPPQAEQFERHEEFVQAAANYAADQRIQQERQQAQQIRFQQDLMSREQAFKAEHPDFDQVVRGGLAGKVSPVLNQALMLIPDGPAVAYALAKQPELVQRLNTLPPPLVLVELGRLSPAPQQASPTPAAGSSNGTTAPTTPAPPLPEPMAPVGGGGSMVAPTYNENGSQSDYEKWRARTSNIPYVRRS